jgi:V8-like Glu-specific endopeptidase
MRRLLLVAAVVMAGLSTIPAQVGAAPGNDVAGEHRRIVGYWTPARRAAAVPRIVSPRPMGKPGGGGSGPATVTGATWTGGGDVAKSTGKVFFTLGGVDYVCSGSAVQSGHQNLVLSAGHCVHDGNGGPFATNWIFYPGWNNGPNTMLGAWSATRLYTTATWANQPDGFDDDAGFAVVTGASGSPSLESVLAGQGAATPTIRFDGAASTTDNYSAFGYPASKKYRGNLLTYCSGTVRVGIDGADTMALACNMTGGSSGGPWLVNYANGSRVIESLNSYGYASLTSTMFGPIFGTVEQATYNAASTNTCEAGSAAVCSR